MTTPVQTRYAGYRFPAEIIGHPVWLYFRFPHGGGVAGRARHHRQSRNRTAVGTQIWPAIRPSYPSSPAAGDKWHFDEVVLKISGVSTGCGGRWIRPAW